MRAVVINEYGNVDKLVLQEVPTPNADSGVISVNAANDLTAQDNIVSIKMGEGSNPKLASDTQYFYFVLNPFA